MSGPIVIEHLDPRRLDLLEPLWYALLDHIVDCRQRGADPPRRRILADASRGLRRVLVEGSRSFALVVRRGDRPIGYALVKVEPADAVWFAGEPHAELESLSVLPDERGAGVGTLLMDAVDAELERLGVTDLLIGVDSVNEAALRFYRRRGYRHDFHIFYGHAGPQAVGLPAPRGRGQGGRASAATRSPGPPA